VGMQPYRRCQRYGCGPTELEMFQKSISKRSFFNFLILIFVLFEKISKLPSRSQAIGADGLAVRPSNLKCFKENLEFFILFFLFLNFFIKVFHVWQAVGIDNLVVDLAKSEIKILFQISKI
jgi:hypothetical protein